MLSKNQFLEKNYQNSAIKVFNSTWIHVFLPSFAESGSDQTGADRAASPPINQKQGLVVDA